MLKRIKGMIRDVCTSIAHRMDSNEPIATDHVTMEVFYNKARFEHSIPYTDIRGIDNVTRYLVGVSGLDIIQSRVKFRTELHDLLRNKFDGEHTIVVNGVKYKVCITAIFVY